MAKSTAVPRFVLLANKLTTALLRAGVKLNGPGKCPMYLLTVAGRKSGLPRTTPIAIMEFEGKRYLGAPYGSVDWVRNLRAAGEGTLTRGRRDERARATELSTSEGAAVLQRFKDSGNPIMRLFGLSATATAAEVAALAETHPVFLMQTVGAPVAAGER